MSQGIRIRNIIPDPFFWSVNNKPYPIDEHKRDNIQIGDRHTVFLGKLFTNTFLLDLQSIGIHKTLFINFITTREHSFSLHHSGNRNLPYDVKFGKGTEAWGKGTVRNLEQYFDIWKEDILEFNIIVHKANAFEYAVDLAVNIYGDNVYKIMYLPNGGRYTFVDQFLDNGKDYKAKSLEDTTIRPRGLSSLKEWNTKSDGTGTSYIPGTIISDLKENIVLYAIWDPERNVGVVPQPPDPIKFVKFTTIPYPNFGISSTSFIEANKPYELPKNSMGSPGYYFIGYNFIKATTAILQPGDIIDVGEEDITIYAIFNTL